MSDRVGVTLGGSHFIVSDQLATLSAILSDGEHMDARPIVTSSIYAQFGILEHEN